MPISLLTSDMLTYKTKKKKKVLTPIELVAYTIINYIHLKTKKDNNLMKLVISLLRSLFKLIDRFLNLQTIYFGSPETKFSSYTM